MLRGDSIEPTSTPRPLTDSERQQYAERFADAFLDPAKPWLRDGLVMANWDAAREVANRLGPPFQDRPDPQWLRAVADATQTMDRARLIELIDAELRRRPCTEQELQDLLRVADPSVWREAFESIPGYFVAKRGRKPKAARSDLPNIAEWGDRLYPVCLKLVTELRSRPTCSIRVCLEGWRQEFPQGCTFLLHHLPRFELALKDKKLRARAVGIEPRAKLLADAMAGADYGLKFRTSIERAREGRRMMTRSNSQ